MEKTSAAVNTPTRVEIDIDKAKQQVHRATSGPIVPIQSKINRMSEYQSRYKPVVDQKKPRTRKAFEAEQAEERVNYSNQINVFVDFDFNRNDGKLLKLNALIQMTKVLVVVLI